MTGVRFSRSGTITGWGSALPDKTLTNADFEARIDTTDAWITERTGIKERHIGGTTAGLATEAAVQALERAGRRADEIDLIILATATPDQIFPASASAVQHAIGARCGAFDVNAACSGFVYALVAGYGFLGLGSERILVIGSETLSRITDFDDRNTGILFADGAGAVVLEAGAGAGGRGTGELLGWDVDSDGSARHLLYVDVGSTWQMDGKEVFRRAVRVMVDSAQKSLAQAGLSPDDVTLVVPHQANVRIIDAACARLGVPTERSAQVLQRTGNTSAASIPLALADALDHGRVGTGDIVLFVGFGAGMTSASAVVRWA